MSDLPTHRAYTRRFHSVLAYIDAHLEGDLSVNTLSQVANFSAFHFHRQFSAFIGVPVSRYVQLMRCAGPPIGWPRNRSTRYSTPRLTPGSRVRKRSAGRSGATSA